MIFGFLKPRAGRRINMNVFVMVDIEGISGIYAKEQVSNKESRFSEGRKCMTDEINVCVKALKESGVEKVYVRDCHGDSYSAIWDQLTEEADYYISGDTADERFVGLNDCDAVILLGYHALAGTYAGTLDHSFSSPRIQDLILDGKPIGEIGVDMAIVGDYGKPVIMVSGDDKACAEAESYGTGLVTAEVKKGLSSYGAMLLPKAKAHALIREKTMEAVKKFKEIKPFVLPKPIKLTVKLVERQKMPNLNVHPYIKMIDARTMEITTDSIETAVMAAFS